jgi:hypothetical protein
MTTPGHASASQRAEACFRSDSVKPITDDSTTSEIRLLKEKLRQLEQRVDTQSKNDYATRANLAAVKPVPVCKGPSAFDPCSEGRRGDRAPASYATPRAPPAP